MNGLWPTFLFSWSIALPATVLAAIVAIPVAYVAARKRFFGKSAVEALIMLPLILPPTVAGYLLVILFGRHGLLGQWIADWTNGYSILFRPEGGIVAAAVVSIPLLYLPTRAAFAGVEREMEETARLNGASTWHVFWLISLPIAWRGVASGLALAFARGLGEFGATMMVMGNLSGRPMTLSLSIYTLWEQGDLHAAAAPVLVLSAMALLLALLFNRLPKG
jgi:molybdate transport system permease protein